MSTGLRHSVIIPAYNAQSTISDSIHSAWQSGADEVIVVDDGSSDNTAEIAASLDAEVLTQRNQGAAMARRAGLQRATGQLISMLDSDDRLIAAGVEKSRAVAATADNWSVVMGVTIGITSHGEVSRFRHWRQDVTPNSLIKAGYSPAPPAALLWNHDRLHEAMFGSTPAVWPRFADDYELLLRGSLLGRVIRHDEPAGEYSLEGGKSTKDPRHSIRASEEIRTHYARLLGLRVRVHGERAIAGRALIRLAKTSDGPSSRARQISLIAKAASLDPAFVARLAVDGVLSRSAQAVALVGRRPS